MANVEHSALTGSNLHEPKGVATATADTVYVADGLGSGTWATLELESLSSASKAFQTQLLHVRDEKTTGTEGGSCPAATWTTRTLNTTVTNGISGASLSSNKITLAPGIYFIQASAPAVSCNRHKIRFRNTTSGTTTIVGTTAYTSGDGESRSYVNGQFSIAGTYDFEIQHYNQAANSGDGFGTATGGSEIEVYAEVMIWKIA